MPNYIKEISQVNLNGKYLLFDTDVLIDIVKLNINSEFDKIFKDVVKCIVSPNIIELLNVRSETEFLKYSKFINVNGFERLDITKTDFVIAQLLQKYTYNLTKCPSLGDYLLAAKLISFGSKDIYILTGNLQDFTGEIFKCVNTYDIFAKGNRKMWGLLERNKRYEASTNSLIEIN